MNSPRVYFTFHGDFQMLLRKVRAGKVVEYVLKRRASLKDIIESLGVPHTEVAQILLKKIELGFGFIPSGGEKIDILPFSEKVSIFSSTLLRSPPVLPLKFMVDINVRKLARNLRMIGLDTTMVPDDMGLVEIGDVATSQQRIIITKNRELLKCSTVNHGYLVRSEDHVRQLQQAVKRYELQPHIKPFTRCITCNGDLKSVTKQAVYHRLEPLTQKYYNTFKLCNDCDKVYWQGSHHDRMCQLVKQAC